MVRYDRYRNKLKSLMAGFKVLMSNTGGVR